MEDKPSTAIIKINESDISTSPPPHPPEKKDSIINNILYAFCVLLARKLIHSVINFVDGGKSVTVVFTQIIQAYI